MAKSNQNQKIYKLVLLAIFIAVVVMLQLFGSGIKIGAVSLSFVLVPIVLGGMLIGKSGGAILGLTFGIITFIGGITGADVFTATLINSSTYGAIVTFLLCIGKATLAGFLSALVYDLLKNKNKFLSVLLASITAPVVNTGVFILGSLLLSDVLAQNFVAEGTTVLYFLIIGCAGINFIVELLINLVVSPSLYYLTSAVSRGKLK